MPVTWEIDDSILVLTLVGDYHFQEPVEAVVRAVADPRFPRGASLLIDARLSKSNRTSQEFRERARWMCSLRDNAVLSRFAIVISSQPHQFGLARMAATHLDTKGLDLEIFADIEEALSWLKKPGTSQAAATAS